MTITVGVDTYVTVAEADTFLSKSIRATSWAGLDTDTKEAALVSAARELQTLPWIGALTTPGQALSWPRSGVTDREGQAISSATVPQDIKNGQIEWAFLLATTPALEGAGSSAFGSNDKRYKAGSVEIEYFRQVDSSGMAPSVVLRWIGHYLNTRSGAGAYATGTDCTSSLNQDYGELEEGLA